MHFTEPLECNEQSERYVISVVQRLMGMSVNHYLDALKPACERCFKREYCISEENVSRTPSLDKNGSFARSIPITNQEKAVLRVSNLIESLYPVLSTPSGLPLICACVAVILRDLFKWRVKLCSSKECSLQYMPACFMDNILFFYIDDSESAYVVDFGFKSKFEMFKQTQNYSEFLSGLPTVFVGTFKQILDRVNRACLELERCTLDTKMYFPPWRSSTALCTMYMKLLCSGSSEGTLLMNSFIDCLSTYEQQKEVKQPFECYGQQQVSDIHYNSHGFHTIAELLMQQGIWSALLSATSSNTVVELQFERYDSSSLERCSGSNLTALLLQLNAKNVEEEEDDDDTIGSEVECVDNIEHFDSTEYPIMARVQNYTSFSGIIENVSKSFI